MHLVTYAYSLKSNHERVQVQLEEPMYTKVTLRLISRLAWSMQPQRIPAVPASQAIINPLIPLLLLAVL